MSERPNFKMLSGSSVRLKFGLADIGASMSGSLCPAQTSRKTRENREPDNCLNLLSANSPAFRTVKRPSRRGRYCPEGPKAHLLRRFIFNPDQCRIARIAHAVPKIASRVSAAQIINRPEGSAQHGRVNQLVPVAVTARPRFAVRIVGASFLFIHHSHLARSAVSCSALSRPCEALRVFLRAQSRSFPQACCLALALRRQCRDAQQVCERPVRRPRLGRRARQRPAALFHSSPGVLNHVRH